MKKHTLQLVFFFLFTTFNLLSQNYAISVNDNHEFNSVFQGLESGNFKGTANGVLIVKDTQHKELLLDFQGSYAELDIEKDEHEIYDISYKKYTGKTTSGRTKIIYQTYAFANALAIYLQGVQYELSVIDGACEQVINGLEYSYTSEKSTEYLIIRVTKEIVLNDIKSTKSIKIIPNSTLVFAINRSK
ncbi:conserved exported hypothetical protein [Tenacibaculum sp. 190524A02b]|uniref:Uncharacterized protein n=1 Tax=Tenacibaculum vairaonense TaxID=3137860 RepID=A0ABP1FA76_9FLAO